MLPSTLSSTTIATASTDSLHLTSTSASASTSAPASASASTPVPVPVPISPSTAAAAAACTTTTTTNEPGFTHGHPNPSTIVGTAPTTASSLSYSASTSVVRAGSGAGLPPSPNAPSLSLYTSKRGPSSSLDGDGQSPESSTSHLNNHDNVSGIPTDKRTRKRRTGPGSRGVANLTPEQLAKKRANDREAQRAIRERTKNQIETLEGRIRELTSQKPYQDLQKIIRQKEAVEAENAELKARMASIMALIQEPIASNQRAEGSYASPVSTFQQPQELNQQSYVAYSTSTPENTTPLTPDVNPTWHGQVPSPSSSYSQQVKIPNQQRHDRAQTNLDLGGGESLKLDFLLGPSQRLNRMQTGVNGAQDSPAYKHLPLKHDWTASAQERIRDHTPTNRVALSPSQRQNQHQNQQQQQQPRHQRIEYAHIPSTLAQPLWMGVDPIVKHSEPTSPLDNVLLDFLHERRQRAAEGVSPQEIVGPRYPSISSLLNPATSVYSHPLSKVFTDILKTFPAICKLPEKIAVLYVMFMIMRWQISPSEENYELAPPFARPVEAQFTVPHPAWIDHIPFPAMREKLVRTYNPAEYLFENFFIPYTTTLSLNWPYEETDTLLENPDGDEVIINPVFQRHLCNVENWTLGTAFDKAFPNLRGTYNLRTDDDARNRDGGLNGER